MQYYFRFPYTILFILVLSVQITCQPQIRVNGSSPGEVLILDSIRFHWCPAGTFLMGSPASETGHRDDEQQVEVTLTTGFWMGALEVTQGQWL